MGQDTRFWIEDIKRQAAEKDAKKLEDIRAAVAGLENIYDTYAIRKALFRVLEILAS